MRITSFETRVSCSNEGQNVLEDVEIREKQLFEVDVANNTTL
jgi:hypothetical protein